MNKRNNIIFRHKSFVSLAQIYRLLGIQIPFKSLKYIVTENYFYIVLECDFLTQDLNDFNENLFTFSEIKHFLTSFRFYSSIHMDNNEKIINIRDFHHYHTIFHEDLKTKNSNIDPHLFLDMEELHFRIFCLEFIKNSLKLSKGDFITFNV
jgi:hypothetical protein